MKEVDQADREQLCRWHRFLPSQSGEAERTIQDRIHERFTQVGGFTAELSKRIGWEERV